MNGEVIALLMIYYVWFFIVWSDVKRKGVDEPTWSVLGA